MTKKGTQWSEKRREAQKYVKSKRIYKKGYHLTLEQKQKISNSNKGHIVSKETRQKISNSNKGKICLQATKEKLRLINLGKTGYVCSEKTKEKIRLANIGKPVSQEKRNKISATLLKRNEIKFYDKYIINANYKKYFNRVDILTKKYKAYLNKNWNGLCFYCNKNIVDVPTNSIYGKTIDHQISKLDGFINNISPNVLASLPNIIICCRRCNSQKNGKTYYNGTITISKTILGFYTPMKYRY